MNFNVQTAYGATVERVHIPSDAVAYPPSRWNIDPMGGGARTPIEIKVSDELAGPDCFVISTTHHHDSTLSFTLSAMDVVCEMLERLMAQWPGEWESTKVWAHFDAKAGAPKAWMGREDVALVCRRKGAPVSADEWEQFCGSGHGIRALPLDKDPR